MGFSILSVLLFPSTIFCAGQPIGQKRDKLPFEVAISCEKAEREVDEYKHRYETNSPIWIRCSIKNISTRTQLLKLKDHAPDYGELPYPIGVAVKSSNDTGSIETINTFDRTGKGWWSSYFVWPGKFGPEVPGDTIPIPPGGQVVRNIMLNDILAGCPNIKMALGVGSHTIRLRVHKFESNPLTIYIVPTFEFSSWGYPLPPPLLPKNLPKPPGPIPPGPQKVPSGH
jgi:hypothetical protein